MGRPLEHNLLHHAVEVLQSFLDRSEKYTVRLFSQTEIAYLDSFLMQAGLVVHFVSENPNS